MDIFLEFNNIVGVASILGTIAAWIALYPVTKPTLRKLRGQISGLTSKETSYLESLAKDLELKNHQNRWSDEFYVPVETELQNKNKSYNVPPSYYIVKSINRHLKEQDFNNLSNIEKIDSSQGTTYKSLESALSNAQDNATVVIGPPGSGKTVSLRNLVIKRTHQRLARKTDKIPIFVNLGYYTGFTSEGNILPFEAFLDTVFKSGYQKFLNNRHWERLLSEGRCVFFLDGIDELPRNTNEYKERTQNIEEFVQSWPNTQFILACRELDYNRELSFQQILIKPFDRKHIRSYMKGYFHEKSLYKAIFRSVENSSNILELCKNPFYLNLVCYFSKFEHTIPENKTQLFNFIVDQLIDREKQKIQIDISTFKAGFISSISNLAYFLAVHKMTTTVPLDEYEVAIKNNSKYKTDLSMINYAIKAELLEYNESSGEIRFIHNRFQEYFSSHYILEKYQKNNSVLPKHFFTNIWWRETVLFIAGLEENVDNLIYLAIKQREQFKHENPLIRKWLKLEMTIIAFECIYNNLNFSNNALYLEVRDELIKSYHIGTALDKTKILTALRFDTSEQAGSLIEKALDDKSHWVSERAFFVLSEGNLKLQMNPKAIFKEFGRFFIEGRLLDVFVPIIKVSRKSRLVFIFLPIYFVLIGVNILTTISILYILFAFFRHAAFRLDYALTVECLGCLASILLATYAIIYGLIRNEYPILKKFLFTFPLALLSYYLVFNIPSNFFIKMGMVVLGILTASMYSNYFKKPNESDFSLGTITSYVFGFTILVPINNHETLPIFLESIIPQFQNNSMGISNSKTLLYLSLGLLSIVFISLSVFIIQEIKALNKLSKYRSTIKNYFISLNKKVPEIRVEGEDLFDEIYISMINKFTAMFDNLSILWAQKILLKDISKHLRNNLVVSSDEKLNLLYSLASQTENTNLRDAIYQIIEEEGRAYRRNIE